MNKRIIKQSDELKNAIEYFNDFHDGFLKSMKIISGNKFGQNPPWEKSKQYESNEERLRDTGLWFHEKTGLFIKIHHYNYDWPNKPSSNRIILFLKNVGKIDPDIVRMVGESVIDCEVLNGTSGLGLVFTFSVFANNNYEHVKLKPLEFEKISIHEKV